MRHLLSVIIGVIALACAFMGWSQYCNSHSTLTSDSETTEVSDDSSSLINASDEITENNPVDWGNPIWQSGDTTLCFDYALLEKLDDPASVQYHYLLMIRDSVPLDTCIIEDAFNAVDVDGDDLIVVLGIDSLRYDIRNLPKRLKPVLSTLGVDNCKYHKFELSYPATKSDWKICNTYFEAFLPQQIPSWTKQLLDILVGNYANGEQLSDYGMESVLQSYHRRLSNKSIQTKQSPEQIMARHGIAFKCEYQKEWAPDSVEIDGPKCDRVFQMTPVWRSTDGQFITYRVYGFGYDNGAHGYMEGYYLTFNQKTGKLLGMRDLVKANKIPQVYATIGDKITSHTREWQENNDPELFQTADFNSDVDVSNVKENTFLKEIVNGKVYPRPALTRQGLVVSYQPYEKGCFAEGILHFVVPYDQLNNALKIKR